MLLGLFLTEREVMAVLALEVQVVTLFLLVIRPSSVASSSSSSSDTT